MSINIRTRRFLSNICTLRYSGPASEPLNSDVLRKIRLRGEDFDKMMSDLNQLSSAISLTWKCIWDFQTWGHQSSHGRKIFDKKRVIAMDYNGYYAEVTKRQEMVLEVWADSWKEAKEINRLMLLKGYYDYDFSPLFEEINVSIIDKNVVDRTPSRWQKYGVAYTPKNK